MKLIEEKTSKNGEERVYVFVMNRDEITVLYGLVKNAYISMPRLFELTQTRGRLKNMFKALHGTLRGKAEEWDLK